MTPERFAALHAAAFADGRPWSVASFASLWVDPGVFAVGDARAAALGRVVLDEAELLTLATHPAHRRLGLGRATLAAFEEQARARGARRAFLEVRANNAAACALYAAAGYAEAGRRRGYYKTQSGARVDALMLSKPLT